MTNTPHISSLSSSQDVASPDLGLDHSLLHHSLASPGKSNISSEHTNSTASPAKLVAGAASSTATVVSQSYSSSSKLNENPLSTAKTSPMKIIFSPKRHPPTTSITSERIQASPEQFLQVTQVLSTETLTTWSSNSPLTSPPQGLKSPPLPSPIDLTAKNAPLPSEKSGTALSSGAHSPKTEVARKKLASLQAELDAARFNADEFLASLKSSNAPRSSSSTGKGIVTSKSSPARTSRAPMSSTTPSPRSKVSPSSSLSGAKKIPSTSVPRPSKPFMSMPANSSASKKKVATREISTSPEKEKRESQSGQATKLKASSGHGKGDQLSKSSPSRKTARGTPTKEEAGKLHKSTTKGGSKFSPSSEAKRPSHSEAVKSSCIQSEASEASEAKKRHVHIQEPQLKSNDVKESTVMSSGGGNPHELHIHTAASSAVDTSVSSAKSTLSSLLTSHTHVFTTSSPPLSTLTVSTSPSSQGHTPPMTASSTASHSIISTHPVPSSPSKIPISQSSEPPLVVKPLMKGPTLPIMKISTVDPSALKVPDSLCFSQVCCVGVSISDQLTITNVGERWLQLDFRVIHLYRDGTEVCLLGVN